MKKFLSLLLAVMMLLGCIPAMAEDALVWKINESLGTLKLDSSSKAVGHVEIPAVVDGVTVMALDYMCFKSTYDITSITIPDTVRMFERSTLDGTANLTVLTLPRDLIIIKNGSLTNMPLIETLTVPASVSVVNGAFSDLPKMKSIIFEGVCPVFVKDSYYGLFANLPADCVIYVPDDQIDAYKAAFADREDVLARIQPSGKNAVVIDWTAPESDFQFDAATGTITGYTGKASRLEIPAAIGGVPVKHIGKQAFLQKYSLMYVTIPEGIEGIEKQAFHGCSLMTYVSFPTTLHTIGDSAFNTNNLVDVGWAEGLESIGNKAFYNCDICYAVLPTTLRTIADSGFENAGFVEVTFGPNVETVGEKGFAAKTIEAITYTGTTMPTFGADAFKGCKKDATLTLADGSPSELYDGFVTYMASAFPACVVNEPVFASAAIEGFDHLLGVWYDDIGNTLTIVNDGTMTYTYASDGWVNEYKWNVVDGAAVVTEGNWAGCPITLENGILTVTNGEGIFQIFSVDGDLSAYYGEDESYEMPEAAPVGSEGEAYFGSWKGDMYGMEVILTLNQDGTCAMEMFGEAEPGVWSVVDGKANIMGDVLYINGDGNLVYESMGTVFTKADEASSGDEMSDEEFLALLELLAQMEGGETSSELPEALQPYVGTWHMVYIATGGLEGDLRAMGLTAKLELNADGTGKLSGAADDSGKWYDDEGTVRFGKADTPLVLLDGGFLRYGSQLAGYMVFNKDANAVYDPNAAAPAPAAPAAPSAPAASGAVNMGALANYTDKKYVAKTYTVAGFTTDASMLGAEYALTLYANNTCELSMAGFPVLLKWTQEADRLVIDYMGAATYYVTLTDAGINLDMNGMLLNMVAQ